MRNIHAILLVLLSLGHAQGQIQNFDSDVSDFKNKPEIDSVYSAHLIDTSFFSVPIIRVGETVCCYADSLGNRYCRFSEPKRDSTSLDSLRITDFGYRIELYAKGLIQERRYYSFDKSLYAICYFRSSNPYKAIIVDDYGEILSEFTLENDVWYSRSLKDQSDKAELWSEFQMIEQLALMPKFKEIKVQHAKQIIP